MWKLKFRLKLLLVNILDRLGILLNNPDISFKADELYEEWMLYIWEPLL